MGKIPNELRDTIARNIRDCRMKKYPGRGGGKKCAEDFGVSPQQWSPWERGVRTPDELRLSNIAEFFGVTVEYLRRDNSAISLKSEPSSEPQQVHPECGSFAFTPPHVALPSGGPSTDYQGKKEIVYVPIVVLLPHLPDDLKALYDQFNATMNGALKGRKPSG